MGDTATTPSNDNRQVYIKIIANNTVTVLPTPSEYAYTEADFDSPDSTRSETGYLVRKRIRRGVRTIKCKWKAISTEELNVILTAIEPKSMNVYYFDPKTNGLAYDSETKMNYFNGYAQATRTATIILPRANSSQTLWSLECTFIEY